MTDNNKIKPSGLIKNVSPLGAWALSLGTSIGWGSLVVTSKTYLLQAGPLGSVIGMIIGGLIMIVISRNYHYLIGNSRAVRIHYRLSGGCSGGDFSKYRY